MHSLTLSYSQLLELHSNIMLLEAETCSQGVQGVYRPIMQRDTSYFYNKSTQIVYYYIKSQLLSAVRIWLTKTGNQIHQL